MTADLVGDALQMALWSRKVRKGAIVHSDRAGQYCSSLYQSLLPWHDLRCSISAKGNCYDNACIKSFFHSLKVEAIRGERFATREARRRQVFEYIELDYNRQRRYSAIGMSSPEAFEARMIAKIAVHRCWVRSEQLPLGRQCYGSAAPLSNSSCSPNRDFCRKCHFMK
jgi:transposase InsO family protein